MPRGNRGVDIAVGGEESLFVEAFEIRFASKVCFMGRLQPRCRMTLLDCGTIPSSAGGGSPDADGESDRGALPDFLKISVQLGVNARGVSGRRLCPSGFRH